MTLEGKTLLKASIAAMALIMAADVEARTFNDKEQQAFIEASQVITSVILCAAEVGNADGDAQAKQEALDCMRAGLADDLSVDTPGGTLTSANALLAFFGGVRADQQTNVTILVNNYLVSDIDVGSAGGGDDDDDDDDDDESAVTGTIELIVWTATYHDVVSPVGPFPPVLGPQFFSNKNIFVMEAEVPGEWKVVGGMITTAVPPEPRPQFN